MSTESLLYFCERNGGDKAHCLHSLADGRALHPNPSYFARLGTVGVEPRAHETPFAEIEAQILLEIATDSALESLDIGRSPPDAARQLRSALEETIARLASNARSVAILTGGGLDSGGLLALTHAWAKRNGRRCFAVAIDFEDHGDDRPYLRALEEHLPCEVLRVVPEDGAQFVSMLDTGVDAAPLTSPTAWMELAAYASARDAGADCIFTGAGGDHLFDGHPRSLAGHLRDGRPLTAWCRARSLRGFTTPRHPFLSWAVRPFLTEALPRRLRARLVRVAPVTVDAWAGPLTRQLAKAELRRRRLEAAEQVIGRAHHRPNNGDRVRARIHHQIHAVTGLRRVDPYTDFSLKSFVRRIPRHWLLFGNVRRGLFREALRDVLPNELRQRQDKSSFEAALVRFVRASGGFARLRPYSSGAMLSTLGVLEANALRPAFERMAESPHEGPAWVRVWPWLVLEAFARSNFGGSR